MTCKRDVYDAGSRRHGLCIGAHGVPLLAAIGVALAPAGCGGGAQRLPATETGPVAEATKAQHAHDAAAEPSPSEPPPSRATEPAPCPRAPADARELPPRDEVFAQIRCVQPDVRACGAGRYASLNVEFTITGSTGLASCGPITARTDPVLDGAPESPAPAVGSEPAKPTPADPQTADCVARAIARMRFAPFTRESLSITAPFSTL